MKKNTKLFFTIEGLEWDKLLKKHKIVAKAPTKEICDLFGEEFDETADAYHGMTVAKKHIDMMGGKISFESEYQKGTKFTVYLPFLINSRYQERILEKQEKNIKKGIAKKGKKANSKK